jgi:hypothetical protein
MYFKDQNPEIETEILFTDLRTPGAPVRISTAAARTR